MPFAKFDLDLRATFAEAPEKDRASAVALYWSLVMHSAEMLADGRISRAVMDAVCDEIGLQSGWKTGRIRDKTVSVLITIGVIAKDKTGSYRIVKWDEHHSSKAEVTTRRKADAERKRRSRGQLTLEDVTPNVRTGHGADVRADTRSDSRAHARRRSEAEAEELLLKAGPELQDAAHTNGLPIDKELEVQKLLAWIGSHGDEGTAHVVRHRAYKLPLAGLVRIRESSATKRPANRAAYVVAALNDELTNLDDEPDLQ